MSRKAAPVTVSVEERKALESVANSRTASYRQVQRAHLVLLAGELHVILDNVSSHDSKEVKEPRNRRVVFHCLPTYSSWPNLIEVLFNLLQAKVLHRGVFSSKKAFVAAIMEYIQKFNEEERPFRWTKTAEAIISSVNNPT